MGTAMNVEVIAIRRPNVTLVYEAIDLNLVSRDKLHQSIKGHAPAIQDIPEEGMALVYRDLGPLVCTIDRRRVKAEADDMDSTDPILNWISDVAKIIPKSSNLLAIGFNFQWVLSVDGGKPEDFITNTFIKKPEYYSELFEGNTSTIKLTMKANRKDNALQVEFIKSNDRLLVQANYHMPDVSRMPTDVSLKREHENAKNQIRKIIEEIVSGSNDR